MINLQNPPAMLASQIYLLALCSYFLISLSLPLLFANCLFTNSQKVVSLALGGRVGGRGRSGRGRRRYLEPEVASRTHRAGAGGVGEKICKLARSSLVST